MSPFADASILVCIAAGFSYLNYRFVRLPTTIGVTLMALIASLVLIIFGEFDPTGEILRREARLLLQGINFHTLLLEGMLSFLLFAGALHIDLDALGKQKGAVTILATVGMLVSMFIVGGMTWLVLRAAGLGIPIIDCVLFGALISPTDPIAVLAIMKTAGAPKSLETKIAGESLFNDGIGVVAFLVIQEIASGSSTTPGRVLLLAIEEPIGGAIFGLAAGWLAYQMLKRVNNYQVEVLLTLALAMGGYTLANALHLSGPIAIVVAGLLIGNQGRAFAMSPETREHLDTFWELIDEILNVVLFLMIGLAVLIMPFTWRYLLAGLAVIPIVLLARWASVAGAVTVMKRYRPFSPGAITILTWGGLRGGISVALALSVPILPMAAGAATDAHSPRDVMLACTYAVVIFSILVQGLTVGKVIERKLRQNSAAMVGDAARPASRSSHS